MNAELTLRKAQLSDRFALSELEQATFNDSCISQRSFKRFITSAHNHCWVVSKHTQLAGYAIALTRKNSRVWRLYSIAVAAGYRKAGVGNALIQRLMSQARQQGASAMSLEVKCSNRAAIHWYQRLGFETVDVLPNYYDDSDGFKMRFTFCPENP